MKIVSEVYSEAGKTLLGVGQAILIASVVAKFFTQQQISWWTFIAGLLLSLIPTISGLALIQKGYNLKKVEENSHDEF